VLAAACTADNLVCGTTVFDVQKKENDLPNFGIDFKLPEAQVLT
jgi:hypothetical protein